MKKFIHALRYQDLFIVFIWREFSIRYKQSVLGVLWAIVQPISMMLLFTLVFTYIIPTRISQYPYPLFFYSSLLPWTFFASSLNFAIPSLVNHYTLITKIYFPKEVLPLSGIAVAFIDFLIASTIFFFMLILYGIHFTYTMLWFFPLVLILGMFTISISLVLSALNVYYRDVKLAINFLIQIWFFGTPVFYSVDKVNMKIKWLLFLNPLTFIIENIRRCLIEERAVVWWQYMAMLVFNIGILFMSYRFFKITENRFADVI